MVVMYGAPRPDNTFPWWQHPMPVVVQPVPTQPMQPIQPLIGCGWECPRCKSINAPYVTKCDCKPVAEVP